MEIAKETPPYVVFETRAIEDRNLTIEAGHFVAKDVDFAVITPAGSKDQIEREVTEWFAKLQKDVRNGRFPQQWLSHYESCYKAWKSDQEMPVSGTPIKTWPALSPAQVQTILAARITTVEALANANEESLRYIGMGSRALKQRAIEWLQSAETLGKPAEKLAKLQAQITKLTDDNAKLLEAVTIMKAKLQAVSEAK